jgi:hypothetical protein
LNGWILPGERNKFDNKNWESERKRRDLREKKNNQRQNNDDMEDFYITLNITAFKQAPDF